MPCDKQRKVTQVRVLKVDSFDLIGARRRTAFGKVTTAYRWVYERNAEGYSEEYPLLIAESGIIPPDPQIIRYHYAMIGQRYLTCRRGSIKVLERASERQYPDSKELPKFPLLVSGKEAGKLVRTGVWLEVNVRVFYRGRWKPTGQITIPIYLAGVPEDFWRGDDIDVIVGGD